MSSPSTQRKRKSSDKWDQTSPPKRCTVSPPSSAGPGLASMTTLASPSASSPPRAPSPSLRPESPPSGPHPLQATDTFDQDAYFAASSSSYDEYGDPKPDPALGWTRAPYTWWNPAWVWERAAINKPDGGYCETCVGDYAATDYAASDCDPLETRSGGFGGFGRFGRFDKSPEPFKPHDTWIDPEYRDDPEQQRPWYDGYGRPYRASKEYEHEDRWTDSDPEGPVGNWPSQRPTFAGRRGAAAQKLFDELLELRMVRDTREERARLLRELEEMQRAMRMMGDRMREMGERAEEMRQDCERVEKKYREMPEPEAGKERRRGRR